MEASLLARQKVPTAHMAKTTLKVEGMTCGACTSAVEAGFHGVDGAGAVSVSLVMGRAVVNHDPTKLSAAQVAEIIEDRGFDAEVLSTDIPLGGDVLNTQLDSNLRHSSNTITTLAVEGMTCGACTSAVEAGFKDVDGIKSMSVSLLSERAVVEHNPSIISAEQVAEIIEDRGFGATVIDSKQQSLNTSFPTAAVQPGVRTVEVVTTTVAIQGMTCGACTSAVEGAFKDVAGLVQFNISLLAERALVLHDPAILPTAKILELIEDAGFEANLVSTQSTGAQQAQQTASVQLKIYGLSDGAAATAVETQLREIKGVSGAVISLATSRATITYTPSLTGLRTIVEAVEDAGYNALIAETDDNNAQLASLAKTKEIQEWKRAFLVSLSFAVPVFFTSMVIPMFLPALNFGAIRLIPGLYLGDLVCLLLTIPVQFGIGKRFYISAFKSIKHRSPTMDVLVVLGTSAAFFFSVFAMVINILLPPHSKPGTVFDTSTMLITFITLGRWLENRAKGQTSKALSNLMSLAPSMATIYEDPLYAEKLADSWSVPSSPIVEKRHSAFSDTPQVSTRAAVQKNIPTELIEVGDIVILRPGDKVPADGTVTRGESYIDESMVTGEAMPILKKKGGLLMAGTVNGAGRLDFRVTRAGKDTQLSQIVSLVQQAQTTRAPIQRIADLVAGFFVPIIIMLGLTTFIGWMVLSHVLPRPPRIFLDQENGGKFMVCLKLCISVIVFACPCALGLATPTAVMVGTGAASQQGILVKGGAALEIATKVTTIVFDKTGTLTLGRLEVAETRLEATWTSNDWRRRLWWTLVGLAELNSEHPIGKSILGAAKHNIGLGPEDAIDGVVGHFQATVGQGVTATMETGSGKDRSRYEVLVGNANFMKAHQIQVSATAEADLDEKSHPTAGMTTIHVAISGQYAGTICLSDTLKPTAPATITALHKMGISTSLVTGDTYSTAVHIARQVGIPLDSIKASVSPSEKQQMIADLQSQGEVVAMVGDGINDSPALATANFGIGLVSGSDIAVEAADCVIMRSEDLLNIPAALCLCHTIFRRIKLNLLFACVYNLFGLPFAMGFFLPWGYSVHPMLAGAAMALSSVSVTLSSLALRWTVRPTWLDEELLEKEFGKQSVPVRGQRQKFGLLSSMQDTLAHLLPGRPRTDTDRGDYVPLGTVEPPV